VKGISPFRSQKKSTEIFSKSGKFFDAGEVSFSNHKSPQTHHEFTIKAPSKKRTLLATPIKKRP
jgi:hypothetical protein